jgi:nitrite reductase (NADH) small subunit
MAGIRAIALNMTEAEIDVTAAPLSAIPPGEGRTFVLGGIRVAIFHMRDGSVYATQADCPHKKGPLADGLTGAGTVVCPLHSWKFDLATGNPVFGDCGIKTYPARLDHQQRVIVKLSW